MKEIQIYRDPSTRRLGFQVREDRKLVWNEISNDVDIRKLRRHLRRAYGRSVRLSGLAG